MLTTRENRERFEKALKDFEEFMDDYDEIIFFDPSEYRDEKTYEVTITGLSYTDAQNAFDFGMEFGASVNVTCEGSDEDGNK